MSDKPVHERISHRIMVYVGTAGKLANQFSIEDIIKEELKPMESQLREADVTATAMGLAYSEMRQENEKLLESAHTKSNECNGLADQVIELRNENARLREDHAQLRDALAIAQSFVSDFRAHGIDDNLRGASVSGVIRHALKTTALADHSSDVNKMAEGGKEGA